MMGAGRRGLWPAHHAPRAPPAAGKARRTPFPVLQRRPAAHGQSAACWPRASAQPSSLPHTGTGRGVSACRPPSLRGASVACHWSCASRAPDWCLVWLSPHRGEFHEGREAPSFGPGGSRPLIAGCPGVSPAEATHSVALAASARRPPRPAMFQSRGARTPPRVSLSRPRVPPHVSAN